MEGIRKLDKQIQHLNLKKELKTELEIQNLD